MSTEGNVLKDQGERMFIFVAVELCYWATWPTFVCTSSFYSVPWDQLKRLRH